MDAKPYAKPYVKSQLPGIRAQAGFHLLEVLVGMCILFVVVVIVAGYVRNNRKVTGKSDTFFASTGLASSYLEKSKQKLADPDTLKLLLKLAGTGSYDRTAKETFQGKEYRVTVNYRRLSPTAPLMQVKATVRWEAARTYIMGTVYPFTP